MPEILLYSSIEPGSAARFRAELAAAGKAPIVRINSPGGSVFDGLAMANAITAHGNVKTVVDGLAASIASLIAVAARRVEMASNALLMIHDPWLGASQGRAEDLRRDAEALDRTKATMLDGYVARTGKSAAEIASLMAAETWFTADEALSAGLVDSVIPAYGMAAELDLSRFNNLPARIAAMTNPHNTARGRIAAMTTNPQTTTPTAPAAAPTDPGAIKAAAAEMIRAHAALLDQELAPLLALPNNPHAALLREAIAAAKTDLSITPDVVRAQVLAKIGESQIPIFSYTRPSDTGGSFAPIEYGPNAHHLDFEAAAVDALLLRGQVPVAKPHPAAKDIRGMSLVQMAETLLSQQGRVGFGHGSPIKTISAAMSSGAFPRVLADTAGKALMRGYEMEPASHRSWTRETDAPNFKPLSRVAISEAPELLEKHEAGEYKAGDLEDLQRGPNFRLVTFGRLLILTRESLINDDLGAFTRLPLAFGAAAARKEADIVYGLLTTNPLMTDGKPLFHADHANLMTGAALGVTSLSAARAAMRKQRGPNGGYLNPVPRYLLVPAALETTALILVSAERVKQPDGADPTALSAAAQLDWISSLTVVVDPRLDDADPGAWYLAADHNQVDTVERVYLNGQRGVFTEENTDFNTDNFQLKARLDFAATIPDWVGLSLTPAPSN